MSEQNNFKQDNLYALSDREQAREKINMFFGDRSNFIHPSIEAINNNLDEVTNNFETGEVTFILHNDLRTVTLKDTGRGIPIDTYEKSELLFRTLFAGGKYDVTDNKTTGTFGCGLTATNYNCELFKCTSYLNGKIYQIEYENGGYTKDGLVCIGDTNEHGTTLTFKLDESSFDRVEYDPVEMELVIRRFSQVSPNVTIKYIYGDEVKIYNHTKESYFDTYSDSNLGNPIYGTEKHYSKMTKVERKGKMIEVEETIDIDAVLAATISEMPLRETVLNGNYLKNNGTIYDGILDGVKSFTDKYCKENKLYKNKEKFITTGDVEMAISFTCKISNNLPSYENQTKFSTDKKYYKQVAKDYIQEQLEVYKSENKKDFDRMVQQILICKRANDVNVKARLNLKQKLSEEISVGNKPKGLYDCKNVMGVGKRRIFINEGDSAGNALLRARNRYTDAIYSLTGKILNCLKANPYTIFKNDIVVNIYRILGCGVEIKTKDNKEFVKFDISKLRYDELIIATDADVDGYDIRTLVLTMIWVVSPSLILDGKVFIVEAPLYEIETKEKTHYAIDDKERDLIIGNLKGKKFEIERNKGLGQMDSKACSETIMKVGYEGLYKVTPTDMENMIKHFELFMGEDVEPRKKYIIDNFYKYDKVL